jgi:hypothetical protein
MQGQVAAINRSLYRGRIFWRVAARADELRVDGADVNLSGVVRLKPIGDLQELLDRSVDAGEWPLLPEFHPLARSDSAALMWGTWIKVCSRR